jgi:hypothetical protein
VSDVASGEISRTADEIGFEGHEISRAVPCRADASHSQRSDVLRLSILRWRRGPKARQPTMVDRESATTRL